MKRIKSEDESQESPVLEINVGDRVVSKKGDLGSNERIQEVIRSTNQEARTAAIRKGHYPKQI
jgi:hypothetical protein